MHWFPLRAPRLCCPGDSGGGHWLSPTTLGAGPTARSPLSVLLQAAGALWLLAWGTWVGAFALETLAEVSRYEGRSPCLSPPAQPLSVWGGAPGTRQEPLPGQSHPLPGWGGVEWGPRSLPPPAGPVPWHGVPRMDLAPSYYLLESPAEERWQVPPHGSRSLWTGLPTHLPTPPRCPLPQRGRSLLPVLSPSFVFGNNVL